MSPLPSPPRPVPRRLWLRRWHPFGALLGIAIAFVAVLLLTGWQRDGFASPRQDWRLDAGCEQAVGVVTEIAVQRNRRGAPDRHALASFRFTDAEGREHLGESWVVFGAVLAGDRHGVEYLAAEPQVSRLQGGRKSLLDLWLQTLLGPVLLPLFLLLAVWARSCRRLRLVLAQGEAHKAVLLERAPHTESRLPWLRRWQRLRVRYAFQSADGARVEASARPLARSELGRLVLAAAEGATIGGAVVLHCEWAPGQPELAAVSDLAPALRAALR